MLDIVIRPRAQYDIETMTIFIAMVQGRPDIASNYVQTVFSTIKRLATDPEIGEHFSRNGLANQYRRILANHHWLYYTLENRKITLWRVIHEHRDIDELTISDLSRAIAINEVKAAAD